MHVARSITLAAVAVVFATACSDEGPEVSAPGVTVNDLIGTWQASSHVITNNANGAEVFDLIANDGETRMTVLSGGRARTWITVGDCAAGPELPCQFYDEFDAALSISGDVLTATSDEVPARVWRWTFTLTGNTLSLTDANTMFDFTLQGGATVSATQQLVLTRQ